RQEKLATLDKPLLVEILRYLAEHQTNNAGASGRRNPIVAQDVEPVIQSLG
ncbi:Leucine-zipper-like transcriptional regulator 1, partial [Perkinsus olseni]